MTQTGNAPNKPNHEGASHADEIEEYGGGEVESRHGYIPMWLLAVYMVLFVWGLYYAFHFWGGLGPGRIQ